MWHTTTQLARVILAESTDSWWWLTMKIKYQIPRLRSACCGCCVTNVYNTIPTQSIETWYVEHANLCICILTLDLLTNKLSKHSLQHTTQTSLASPPLLPKVDAILVMDNEGNRLAGKYYGDFLRNPVGDKSAQELRTQFETNLHQKLVNSVARPDAAEVITLSSTTGSNSPPQTAVFCGGNQNDVKVVHVGPAGESELVLAHLCEGMYEALQHLMGGSTERSMVLDNLELVFLLIDEHCDGGIILEVDGHKLASAVLLRDEDASGVGGEDPLQPMQAMPPGAADMTLGQAFRQARDSFFVGMASRDGM